MLEKSDKRQIPRYERSMELHCWTIFLIAVSCFHVLPIDSVFLFEFWISELLGRWAYITSNVHDNEVRFRFQNCRSNDLSHVCNIYYFPHCMSKSIQRTNKLIQFISYETNVTFLFSIIGWFPVVFETENRQFSTCTLLLSTRGKKTIHRFLCDLFDSKNMFHVAK